MTAYLYLFLLFILVLIATFGQTYWFYTRQKRMRGLAREFGLSLESQNSLFDYYKLYSVFSRGLKTNERLHTIKGRVGNHEVEIYDVYKPLAKMLLVGQASRYAKYTTLYIDGKETTDPSGPTNKNIQLWNFFTALTPGIRMALTPISFLRSRLNTLRE